MDAITGTCCRRNLLRRVWEANGSAVLFVHARRARGWYGWDRRVGWLSSRPGRVLVQEVADDRRFRTSGDGR